jgi:cytochrome c-type biogenesis protein CcmH
LNSHIILFWLIIALMTLLALTFILLPFFKLGTSRKLATLLLIITPVFALTYYLKFGASQPMAEKMLAEQRASQIQSEITRLGSKENIIIALQQRLQENPESAQGWYLLGRMYLMNQNYQSAMNAFDKANSLEPNKPETMLSYAEASYFYQHQTLDGKALQLLNEVLKTNPENNDAINLLAINAYQHKHYQQAIDYWKTLLAKFPADSEDENVLLTMIHNAKQKINS